MNPKDLAAHKHVDKFLPELPKFKKLTKDKLPKPFNRMGRPGLQTSELMPVSDEHRVLFLWRDGPERTDRSFFAYLLCVLQNGDLYPLFEMHYHPSHKGLHCKLPCKTTSDYRNRLLPGAPELDLKSHQDFDPRSKHDREALITLFCNAVGVRIPATVAPMEVNLQGELWN
jgi:hypothetical protein